MHITIYKETIAVQKKKMKGQIGLDMVQFSLSPYNMSII